MVSAGSLWGSSQPCSGGDDPPPPPPLAQRIHLMSGRNAIPIHVHFRVTHQSSALAQISTFCSAPTAFAEQSRSEGPPHRVCPAFGCSLSSVPPAGPSRCHPASGPLLPSPAPSPQPLTGLTPVLLCSVVFPIESNTNL